MNEQFENMRRLIVRTTFKDWLAAMVMLASYIFLYLLLKMEMPDKNKEILYVAVGNMFGVVTTVIAYYFGTSKDKSDADKTYNMRKLNESSNTAVDSTTVTTTETKP